MLEELFDAFERKNEHRMDRNGHGRRSDFDHGSEERGNGRYPTYDNHRKHSQDFNFGHLRLTDLLHNKKLKTAALIMIPIAILLLVGIVIIAFPTISRIWDFVSAKGVKGIIEAVMPFVRQLWEGSKG